MRRVKVKVSDIDARARLRDYARERGHGPHNASALADVIWPDAEFITSQGAGAAASRVLKRLGYHWCATKHSWGWVL